MRRQLFNTTHLLKSRIKGLPTDMSMAVGQGQDFIKQARGSRILVYHGICLHHHLRFNTLFIKLKTFEKQLRLYKKYFNIVSLNDYYEQRFSNDKFNICLSFDDGFANNHKYVLPLLEQYQVPAAFFVTGIRETGYDILWNDMLAIAYKYGASKFIFRNDEFIRGRDSRYVSSSSGLLLTDILRHGDFNDKAEITDQLSQYKQKAPEDYWLQMTADQIRELSNSKWVTIGSHSHYHNDLAKLPAAAVKEDITKSKQFLENITGKKITSLAFPYGSYTPEVIDTAKQAGFTQLLATEFIFPGDVKEATLRERLTINPFISANNQLYAHIRGDYK
jgi:peptidoglycan/xylan/chitin deacetylase (PgdA/CDA1 family)